LATPWLASSGCGEGNDALFEDLLRPVALDAGTADARPETASPPNDSMSEGGVVAIDGAARPDTTPPAEDAEHPDAADRADAADPRDAAFVDGTSLDAVEGSAPRVDAPVAPDPAAPIRGLRWEVACTNPNDNPRLCDHLPPAANDCPGDNRPVSRMATFGGAPGTHYDVTLRIRGLLELNEYTGGASVATHLQIGGAPSSTVINTYGLSVSSPKQTLYLNASRSAPGTPVHLAALDDMVTISVDAGATIELFAMDDDCTMLKNCLQGFPCIPYVVPGIPPAPGAFDGQFAQLDVVSVVAR
jgi:hypothetical protein